MSQTQQKMSVSEFRELLDKMQNASGRSKKKDLVRQAKVQGGKGAVSFLAGDEFDDMGFSKKRVLDAVKPVYGEIDPSPTVSDSLKEFDWEDGSNWSVEELHMDLRGLRDYSGSQQKKGLTRLFREYSHPSVVAFAVLDDADTGVSGKTVTSALDLREYYPHYDSVVEILEDPNPSKLQVGRAFKPMLAKREKHYPDDTENWIAQMKLDGNRVMLHLDDGDVTAYSRRQNDITESLPELDEIDWPDGEYIIDGEVIAEDGTYKSTSERIGRKANSVVRQQNMEFVLFDSLLYEGQDISESAYDSRFELLKEFVEEVNHELVRLVPTWDDPREAIAVARQTGEEGIIVRDLSAEYEFDKRKHMVKKKRRAETIDVVVSEVLEGEGRLSGTAGKLAVETGDGVKLGNVGTGFTDKKRDEIWNNQNEWIGSVIEITAEGYDDGLRFPRFEHLREQGVADEFEDLTDILPDV